MQDADLDHCQGPGGVGRFRQALEAVADSDAHVLHAPVLDFSQYREPELRSSPWVSDAGLSL